MTRLRSSLLGVADHTHGTGPPSAELPAMLLPVRLETRFVDTTGGAELWLRFYPDQISVFTYEPELSPAEEAAGTAYWETRYAATSAVKRKAAWQLLSTAYGPERASWIARVLRPENLGSGDPAPQFPTLSAAERRASSWERPAIAVGLPDRWSVALLPADSGEYRREYAENAVRTPLQIGLDPNGQLTADPTGAQIDEGMRWMFDFDEAVAAGMAMRISLSQEERASGFRRLIAYGLHGGNGAAMLAGILRAHRYTTGLAFVPQGSPTNNTPDGPAGYSRKDPGGERGFGLEERGQVRLPDAEVAAAALGVPLDTFEDVEHADLHGERNAHDMAVALWPATLGYFLGQMMADLDQGANPASLPSYHPLLSQEQEEQARQWFIQRVRGRGPLPAFRVGDTPYGVLPITSRELWDAPDASPTASRVAELLKRRRGDPVAASTAPRMAPGGDPDEQLVTVLGLPPTSTQYRIRHAAGQELLQNWANFLQVDGEVEEFATTPGNDPNAGGSAAFVDRAAALTFLSFWGLSDHDPRVGHTALSGTTHPLPFPVVQEGPLSEEAGLETFAGPGGAQVNYIQWLRHASVDQLRDNDFPGGKPPEALLYQVLRQSLLLEYSNQAFTAQIDAKQMTEADRIEPELMGFEQVSGDGVETSRMASATSHATTAWDALDTPIEGVTGAGQTMAQFLWELKETDGTPYGRLGDLRAALDRLAALPTAELDRLFRETIDVCSHRLDAWVTSLATDTLASQRAAQPGGAHLGAFGWVEDLTPPEPGEQGSAGFIHAPSSDQATAAAVLRNGFLAREGTENEGTLAIDLSSERVRIALQFLEGIREGLPLGALLGYRFERALYAAGLAEHVAFFRARYPIVANKLTTDGTAEAAETVAASNVTDGNALYREWYANKAGWKGVPPGETRGTFTPLLEELEEAMDALGDLSISESVFQLVRGNYERAGGLLDAISRGERPPDPDVVRTPRSGTDLTHRMLLMILGEPARASVWGSSQANPRAKAERRLDAWISGLLPDPSDVHASVRSVDGSGTVQTVDVTLAHIGVDPLDLMFMADAADEPQSSELEQRLLYAALDSLPAKPGEVGLLFDRTAAGLNPSDTSFPELLVLVREIRDLVGGARPLAPQDLAEPGAISGPDAWPIRNADAADTEDLDTRSGDAITAADDAVQKLETEIGAAAPSASKLRDALIEASWFGVLGSVPATRKPTDPKTVAALLAQATSVHDELSGRLDAANDADGAFDRTTATAQELRDHLVGLMETIFGASFTVLPQFKPSAADGPDLDAAFAQSTSLLDGETEAPQLWFQQLTAVRQGVARLDSAESMAQLLGAPAPPDLELAQLPFETGDRWLGLPLVPGEERPTAGRVALAARLAAPYDSGEWHCGLIVDEWPERIPMPEQTSGLAFHYDQPGSRAPQSLLLAVSPDARENWDEDALVQILHEAFELAAIRLENVDDTYLGNSQFLPALWFAFDPDAAKVSVEGWTIN